MQRRIETSTKFNRIPEEISAQHKGFSQWDESYNSKADHDTILQVSFSNYMLGGKQKWLKLKTS